MDSPTFLRAVVDTLLPGLPQTDHGNTIPAASEIGIDQQLRQHLQRTHPDHAQLAQALEAIAQQAGSPDDFVAADEATAKVILEQVELTEATFSALLFVVSADYYEAEAVLRAFAWRETPPQPLGYPLPPFNEGLLVPVKQRPKLWRSPERVQDPNKSEL